MPDPILARAFLGMLDPDCNAWEFRTFDDDKARRDPELTLVFRGRLDEHLVALERTNEMGAGVFVTINETDGQGRSAKNITRVRALFADTDGADLVPLLALQPHVVVASSPGRWHCYWRVYDCEVGKFKVLQKAIATSFGTDEVVLDLPRVMRLPGFHHRKDEPHLVDMDRCRMDPNRAAYSVQEVIDGLGLDLSRVEPSGGTPPASMDPAGSRRLSPPPLDTMRAMLEHLVQRGYFEDRTGVECDDQGLITNLSWIETGMALKLAYRDEGEELWAITHLNGRAFDDAPDQWASFAADARPGHITIGTVIKAARDAGYVTEASSGVSIEHFCSFMPTHQYIFKPTGDLWPASSINGRLMPVEIGKGADGEPETISPSRWLDQNQPIEQMTWAPGESQVIRGSLARQGELVEHAGAACFNLYMPPSRRQTGNALAAAPWLDHLRKVYPDDADHIICWFAHRVQHPSEKINHALVLGGAQGIGKDTILAPLKEAVGSWNFHEVSPQQVFGRFNGFLKSVVLRVSEARDLGESSRFQFYDHMKTYTSSPPETLRVDEKNKPEYYIRNCCGIVITTNHKTDGIYLPSDDRRHFVAWSACEKNDFHEQYWGRLWNWYKSSGYAHVAAYLDGVDLSAFDAKAPPPKTPAFWEIVDAGRAPEDAELADAIDAIGKPEALTLECLTRSNVTAWFGDRKNRRAVPYRLENCGYTRVRNSSSQDGMWKVGGQRKAIYAKSGLPQAERMRAAAALRRVGQ